MGEEIASSDSFGMGYYDNKEKRERGREETEKQRSKSNKSNKRERTTTDGMMSVLDWAERELLDGEF